MVVRKIVVELDLTRLDEEIDINQLKEVSVTYFNIGEGEDWEETVPFKVLWYEDESGKIIHMEK